MSKRMVSRKMRFRVALIYAGQTQAAWAKEMGVTPAHLSQVLDGKRESLVLVAKIDAFTRKYVSAA